MKTPIAIIVAIGCHALLIVSRILINVISWETITFRLILVLLSIHGVQMLGIIGLLLKKKWSRKYTMVFFIVIMIMNFGSLDDLSKQPSVLGLILTLVSIILTLYVFHQFYTEPKIQKYLKN